MSGYSGYIYMQPSSFNKAMSCALDKVGNSRMALKDEQQMTLQNVYTARMFFFSIIVYAVFLVCMVTDRYGKYTYMGLTVCIRASHPL